MSHERKHDYPAIYHAQCWLCGKTNERELTMIFLRMADGTQKAVPAHLVCAYRRLLKEKLHERETSMFKELKVVRQYEVLLHREREQQKKIIKVVEKYSDLQAAATLRKLSRS